MQHPSHPVDEPPVVACATPVTTPIGSANRLQANTLRSIRRGGSCSHSHTVMPTSTTSQAASNGLSRNYSGNSSGAASKPQVHKAGNCRHSATMCRCGRCIVTLSVAQTPPSKQTTRGKTRAQSLTRAHINVPYVFGRYQCLTPVSDTGTLSKYEHWYTRMPQHLANPPTPQWLLCAAPLQAQAPAHSKSKGSTTALLPPATSAMRLACSKATPTVQVQSLQPRFTPLQARHIPFMKGHMLRQPKGIRPLRLHSI